MARDSEKAMAMLNRFVAAKKSLASPGSSQQQRRPHLSTLVSDVDEAEKWRRHCIRDLSRLVSAIQNGALGEAAVRDMNDQINKLLREKGHWERQIKALGGTDYIAGGQGRVTDADGRYAMGGGGGRSGKGGGEYFYFGAAKELPGVRELFERKGREERKRTRAELSQLVDAEYYGLRDDEDGLLERLERHAEKKVRSRAEREWKERQREAAAEAAGASKGPATVDLTAEDGEDAVRGADTDDLLGLHVELPSTEDIERQVLARKKRVSHPSLPGRRIPQPRPARPLTALPLCARRRSCWRSTRTSRESADVAQARRVLVPSLRTPPRLPAARLLFLRTRPTGQ